MGLNEESCSYYIENHKIEKQLFVLNIMKHERSKVMQGGVSFVHLEDLCAWSGFDKGEIENLQDVFHKMILMDICSDAAWSFIRNNNFDYELYPYIYELYLVSEIGTRSLPSVSVEAELIDKLCEHIGNEIGLEILDEYRDVNTVDRACLFLGEYYINRIQEVISLGYDWAIVAELTNGVINNQKQFDMIKEHLGLNCIER